MTEEQFHDALNELSDDILAPVERLRMKKNRVWVRWCTAAACVCLAAGLAAYVLPYESANDSRKENHPSEVKDELIDKGLCASQSMTDKCIRATVLEVHDGFILVEPLDGEAELLHTDRIEVSLRDLDPNETYVPGDQVSIYYDGILQECYPARAQTVYSIIKEN